MALISDLPSQYLERKAAQSTPLLARRYGGVPAVSWIALVAFTVLGVALYGCTLGYPFHFDGQPYVINNPLLRDFSSFRSYFDFAGTYQTIREHEMPADVATNFILRPVSYLTFWVNEALGGMDPRGYRLVNILLHVANAFLVFHLLRRLTRTYACRGQVEAASALFIATASALLFLVHPLQVESVTYIAQRFTSLGTFFYLATLLLQFRSYDAPQQRSRLFWGAAAVSTLILGMLSKEICFTAPIMMVLLDALVLGTAWRKALGRAWPLLVCLPLLPCLILAAARTMSHGQATVLDALRVAWPECQGQLHLFYILTEFRVLATYLGLLLLPQGLNVDWGFAWTEAATDWRVPAAATLLLAVLTAAWWISKRPESDIRHRLLFASILWFFVSLSVSSIAPLPDALAEHRTYLPSIGLLTAVICLVDLLRTRNPAGNLARWAPAAVAVWIILLCGLTTQRNRVWRSNIALWQDCVEKNPRNPRGWENLGIAYLQENQSEDATLSLKKAMELRPADTEIRKNLGAALVQQHRYAEALDVCRDALKSGPDNGNRASLHYDMALACLALGRPNRAMEHLQEALAISPKHFLANLFLAGFYADQNNRAAALAHYQVAACQYPADKRVQAILTRIETIKPIKGS